MPFNPRYTITDKILNNLTTINSAREVIEQMHLAPKMGCEAEAAGVIAQCPCINGVGRE